jgi:cold shock CspA family protein
VQWAHALLKDFGLYDFFSYIEIFPGDKKAHFSNLKEMSEIPFNEMVFFDDSRDGRFGNCLPVSQLGVLSVHTPNGLYDEEVWTKAMNNYHEWDKTPNTIVEWDGSMTSNGQLTSDNVDSTKRHEGVVKMVNSEKRFGFIRYGSRDTKDIFFHFSNLPNNTEYTIKKGDKISFNIFRDGKKGKNAATDIIVNGASQDSDIESVEMRVFSMNLPFAALLSNGYKTLETRNGTMFEPYAEGTQMLLHVGQRIYPDGDRHLDVMKSGGLGDDEIANLKSLPKGYGKGMAVAIVEIGKTFTTTLEERCDPDFQRKVAAFGKDSGMRATEIKRVQYLKHGVKVSGRGGVFKTNIPATAFPDGWLE